MNDLTVTVAMSEQGGMVAKPVLHCKAQYRKEKGPG
jgi:hypothetical protein